MSAADGADARPRTSPLDWARAQWARAFRREHGLLIAAVVLAAAGVAVIVAGWLGASHSVVVAEQIPYLISGGLLGVALVFLGALSYYGHGQSLAIRDMRQQRAEAERRHREVLASLGRTPVEG